VDERKGFHFKIFEVFLMQRGIESMPQGIRPMECANRTVVTMTKQKLEVQKLEKLSWTEAVANVVYTLD
jgi:hypothetical protein